MRHGLGMRRALALAGGLAAILAVAVSAAGAASPHIQIAQVDTSRYPLITATVIAPDSDKLQDPELALSEKGKPQTIDADGRRLAGRDRPRARRQPLDGGHAARRGTPGCGVVHQHEAPQRPRRHLLLRPHRQPGAVAGHRPRRARRRALSACRSTRSRARRSTTRSSRRAASSRTEPTLTQGARRPDRRRRHDKTTLAEAVKVAKTAGVTVDAIAIGTTHAARRRSRSIADARPAATCSPPTARAQGITQVYTQIAAEIRNTYRLQYTSHGDGVVPLEVSLKGYTAGTQQRRPARARGRDRRRRRQRLADQQAQLRRASRSRS